MDSETPPLLGTTPPPDNAPPPPPASPAAEITHSASQVSKFDRAAVRKEMAEKGFFTLPPDSRVRLYIYAAPKLQKSNGSNTEDLGIAVSRAPIECFVSVSGEALNPEDPDTTWARLDLTSAELRRLQSETAQVNTQLESLLPKPDERETLSTLIGRSGNPIQAEELVGERKRLAALQAQERQRLAGALLEANPDFQNLVDNKLKTQFNVTGAGLHVGITTPPGIPKVGLP